MGEIWGVNMREKVDIKMKMKVEKYDGERREKAVFFARGRDPFIATGNDFIVSS